MGDNNTTKSKSNKKKKEQTFFHAGPTKFKSTNATVVKTKKPKYKKTNVKVVDAKTGKKKDDGSTGIMEAENFINYTNMKYPNYNMRQTPDAKRNKRQSAKALKIINSRKKSNVNKKYGGKITYRMSGGKVAGAGYDD